MENPTTTLRKALQESRNKNQVYIDLNFLLVQARRLNPEVTLDKLYVSVGYMIKTEELETYNPTCFVWKGGKS